MSLEQFLWETGRMSNESYYASLSAHYANSAQIGARKPQYTMADPVLFRAADTRHESQALRVRSAPDRGGAKRVR